MPRYNRYVMNQDGRILFFTSKPKSIYRTYWFDYCDRKYRLASVAPNEAANYQELFELPEDKLVEVEIRVKPIEK